MCFCFFWSLAEIESHILSWRAALLLFSKHSTVSWWNAIESPLQLLSACTLAVVLVSDWESDCCWVESSWIFIQLFYLFYHLRTAFNSFISWCVTLCQCFITPKWPSFLPKWPNNLLKIFPQTKLCTHCHGHALPCKTEHAQVVKMILIFCIFAKDCLHCNVCLSTIKWPHKKQLFYFQHTVCLVTFM